VNDMREDLTFVVIAAGTSSAPFYTSPYVKAGAILVVAVIILGVALMLFRSSGKKKKENENNASGTPGWQPGQPGAGQWNPQGAGMSGDNQWGQQAAWGAPAQQQPQQAGWGTPPAQQGGWEQQAGWGTPAQQQPQQAAWGTPNPAPQQQAGWEQQAGWGTPAQQQPQQAGWGTPNPAPQQQGGWEQQAAWGAQSPAAQQQPQQAGWGTPPLQAAPAQDPWAQAPQQQAGWGAQSPAQQGFAASGSGQSWGQPAQQAPAQNAWGVGAPPQPTGGPAWGQPAPVQPQSFGSSTAEGADSDRTVLRAGGSAASMPMGGVAPGRLGMVRIEEGKEPGRVYEVRKEALSIGRSRESDIFLEDLAVSRLHASIISQGNGNYALRDEGSANGTKVNGQPVNKYQPYQLQDGDKIQLGQTVLVFGRR
jgi:hypothetical protein